MIQGMSNKVLVLLVSILQIFRILFVLVEASFRPAGSLSIDCGGNVNVTSEFNNDRSFQPDLGSSSVTLSPISHIVVSKNVMGLADFYRTARVFTKTSTYTIDVKTGRYWLRLYFYPLDNAQYDLQNAIFSIKANDYLLREGFSLRRSKRSPMFLEFVIEVVSSSTALALTLTPLNGSVAFINGIEVVLVPDNQFPSSALSIPLGSTIQMSTHVGFETLFRVNMGGPLVTPENDTLWRTWQSDSPFLINLASAHSVSTSPSSIQYPYGTSVEIAPNWIYATAQEMADANVGDQKFNISWVFKVDPGFTYLVRLHFCDIVSKALNNLVFNVYINYKAALTSFDISSKTMELSAAYYVDFAVNVSGKPDEIMIQVGPSDIMSAPSNAIINGLEIMKLSNLLYSFDGSYSKNFTRSKHPKKQLLIIVVTVACLGGLALLSSLVAAYYCFSFQRKSAKKRKCTSAWLPLPTHGGHSETKISTGSYASSAPSMGLGRVLAFLEVREATKNFDENLVIGVGGFGKVYRGMLENGVTVAVKRGNPRSQQGLVEFRTEIQMLSKLRHRHLVSLIGFCEELNEMILVYEYMAGGPLRKHIYGSDLPQLTWKQRLEICIGAAKGLHYLHTGAAETIIHRDVKTTNILLDENLTAKVADFGLSKMGPTLDQTHVSTAVKGSFGYLDPEYFRRQQLTEKSDVYSFGVVLLEVLCARPAINPSLPREQVNIAEWAMHWQKKGHLEQIMDPYLMDKVNLDSVRKFGETAEKCLAEQGSERPTMGDVLWNLEYALQLQEATAQNLVDENSTNYIPDLPDWIPHVEHVEHESSVIVTERESDVDTSSLVFSQLMDPRGR
ncbi:receptor-like protein kinase THESEUS 1 [Aristolochia californica]|uniref:receptor-like protein kinase THESEUS 1 n=1 Tax=Aristolochia californica TaxID=171875 RepID=UPI0035D703D6